MPIRKEMIITTVGVHIVNRRTSSILARTSTKFSAKLLRGKIGSLANQASTTTKATRHNTPDMSRPRHVELVQSNVEPPPEIGINKNIVPAEDSKMPA